MRTGENIYKRKNGYWEGRFKVGYRLDGKIRYRSVYAKSYTEVKEKLKLQQNQKNVSAEKKAVTMSALFESYIRYIKGNVKQSTLSAYQNLYTNHIGVAFGGMKVARLTNEMINEFLLEKLSLYKRNYVLSIRTLLFSLFNYAYREDIITEKFKNIMRIKAPKSKQETFAEHELEVIERHILHVDDTISTGVLLALYTGLRIGELCALRVYDIDLKKGVVNVSKAIQRIKNMQPHASTKTVVIVDSPKSKASVREIPLPPFLIEMLKQKLNKLNKHAYLLTGELQQFIEPRTMENRYKRLLQDCKVGYRNFHTLRHTFATVCVNQHVYDIKTLSEILGHENVEITLNRYVHSSQEVKAKQVLNLDNIFKSRTNSRNMYPHSLME